MNPFYAYQAFKRALVSSHVFGEHTKVEKVNTTIYGFEPFECDESGKLRMAKGFSNSFYRNSTGFRKSTWSRVNTPTPLPQLAKTVIKEPYLEIPAAIRYLSP
jgi:hypothetical protein